MYLTEAITRLHAVMDLNLPLGCDDDLALVLQMEEAVKLSPPFGTPLDVRVRNLERVINPFAVWRAPITAYSGKYSRALCALNPDTLFVFGDNLMRTGRGGQAIIRDQPNALGVATKVEPSSTGYMSDCPQNMASVMSDLMVVDRKIAAGQYVVLPTTLEGRISLGCGLAELPYRAPRIYGMIEEWFRSLPHVKHLRG